MYAGLSVPINLLLKSGGKRAKVLLTDGVTITGLLGGYLGFILKKLESVSGGEFYMPIGNRCVFWGGSCYCGNFGLKPVSRWK